MLSVLGEVQHEELLPSGQMPRRSEIVRTETNLDQPPHPRLLRSHALDVALGHLSLERDPVQTPGGRVAPPEVGPSEMIGCRDLLGDALPDVTLLLPPGQMPSRLEIVSLERDPVRTPGGRVAPLEVGPTMMTWA